MSSPPESSPAKPKDDLSISSSAPSASQPKCHVHKRAIYMYSSPRIAYVSEFHRDPPFDPSAACLTARFGCYPKGELKDPDAIYWYTFANGDEVWDICDNPVSNSEKAEDSWDGSLDMPFGPANSAALTSGYEGSLIPKYATAVTELPQDPTDDPHAIVRRWHIDMERIEAWKDEVAQTAQTADPDEMLPSPPSTHLESPPSPHIEAWIGEVAHTTQTADPYEIFPPPPSTYLESHPPPHSSSPVKPTTTTRHSVTEITEFRQQLEISSEAKEQEIVDA
ncbi:unnamed protein product [Sordaria macrospora k-hell]|uniref:WGS project CABT00000000 data, contig 2.16 n=2 Tax=Sordaria macrospora TaxID=5147 RepID=F7W054_SORMK|nr:uncharacterized protein SMAC_03859 [Sordaria macrospora k-hell]KAH7629767.1 hypothetical protein B0T09DRAFT_264741 [Sordaria sp. MPI-SDFR-AT-0083]CCC11153.1 unnamed protein product [Sordaria macrospora k-hell]